MVRHKETEWCQRTELNIIKKRNKSKKHERSLKIKFQLEIDKSLLFEFRINLSFFKIYEPGSTLTALNDFLTLQHKQRGV